MFCRGLVSAGRHAESDAKTIPAIDSDYRGEIKIILINLSTEPQFIHPGDRIAQMVIQKVEKATLTVVPVLSGTERSNGGFGSTGKK